MARRHNATMKYTRILTAQDASCVGQCSLTVALPILSAMGVETAILPTAILSTHTAGFQGFTFRDLQEDIPLIEAHWKKEGIRFDAIYTGYLGCPADVERIISIHSSLNDGPLFVDPAFADHGVLYGGFDEAYVEAMRKLCSKSDILLPNLTEACFLLNIPYNPNPTRKEAEKIIAGLMKMGAKSVVLKGIAEKEGETGFLIKIDGEWKSYIHAKIPQDFHGTGDVFASVFVGAHLNGNDVYASAKIAADFVVDCIKNTLDMPSHKYGVRFEPLLAQMALRARKA